MASPAEAGKDVGVLTGGGLGLDALGGNGLNVAANVAGDVLGGIFGGLPWEMSPSAIVDAVTGAVPGGGPPAMIVPHVMAVVSGGVL